MVDPSSSKTEPRTVSAIPGPRRHDAASPRSVTPITEDDTRFVEMEMAAATRLVWSRSDAENRDMDTRLSATNAAKGGQCHVDGTFKARDDREPNIPARHASGVPLFIVGRLGEASGGAWS